MSTELYPDGLSPALAHLWATARAVHAYAPDGIIFIGDVATVAWALYLGVPLPPLVAPHRGAAFISLVEIGTVRDYEMVRPDLINHRQLLDRDGVMFDLYVERHHELPLSFDDVWARSLVVSGLRIASVPDLDVLAGDRVASSHFRQPEPRGTLTDWYAALHTAMALPHDPVRQAVITADWRFALSPYDRVLEADASSEAERIWLHAAFRLVDPETDLCAMAVTATPSGIELTLHDGRTILMPWGPSSVLLTATEFARAEFKLLYGGREIWSHLTKDTFLVNDLAARWGIRSITANTDDAGPDAIG